jgi:hypothetical protein
MNTDKKFFVSVLKMRNEMGGGFRDSVWIFEANSKQEIIDKGFAPNIIEIYSSKDEAIAFAAQFSDKHEYYTI